MFALYVHGAQHTKVAVLCRRRRFLSIHPTILVAFVLIVAVSNIVLIVLLARRRSTTSTEPLERISTRLDELEHISGNLESLSRLFLVPHTRGGLGETLLSELLRNWLPEKAFELQYQFRDGSRADAVIKIGNFIVAVDAKFPLEQVRSILEDGSDHDLDAKSKRVFSGHIADIAGKYVRPTEGTLDFAIMYIPSERLYYRAFVDTDGELMSDALRAGIIPTGPSSLFLYLQTVSFGLRGLQLSDRQRELVDIITQLVRSFEEIKRGVTTGSKHLQNTRKNFDELETRLEGFELLLRRLDATRKEEV